MRRLNWYIVSIGLLFFIPFLGYTPLFDWDEINFAECAREMIASGNYSTVQINYQPFWEKPPLFIWMQVGAMKLFGINEFAARFPNVICGVITLLVVYRAGSRLYDSRMGFFWALAFAGSLLPHLYFKSGIIDPWFNLFIFLSFYYYYLGYSDYKSYALKSGLRFFMWSGFMLGLAVMTKGPTAILIAGIAFFIFFITNRFKSIISIKGLLLIVLTTAIVGGIWFLMLILSGNAHVIGEFIDYQIRLAGTQDAGHGGPIYYHVVVLLIGCFPASIIAIRGFGLRDQGKYNGFKLWMAIMFWVTLILFSLVKTKILHYSSLCYFPLTFMAGYTLYQVSNTYESVWKGWMSFLLITIGSIYSAILIAIPFLMPYVKTMALNGDIHDKFAAANLHAEVNWSWVNAIPGFGLLLFLLFSIYFIRFKEYTKSFTALALGMMITLLGAAVVIVPNVEKISQHAAIEFYQDKVNKDVYVIPLGFKSYAHLFYSKLKPYSGEAITEEFLMSDRLDKEAYFVCKITNYEAYQDAYPDLIYLYEKNGFVFYKRNPVSDSN